MLLHQTLENFAALTAGSTVRVTDGKRTHYLDVLDVEGKPLPDGIEDDSRGRAVSRTLTLP